MKSNLDYRNYLKIPKFFLLGSIENAFFTCLYLRNGASPDPQTWNFFVKKPTMCSLMSSSSPLKNQGLNSFHFGENWKLYSNFLLRQYIAHTLFFEYLFNGKRLTHQIFKLVFGEKYFQARFFANVPCAHAPISVLASLTLEEIQLYTKCSRLDLTYIRRSLSQSIELNVMWL